MKKQTIKDFYNPVSEDNRIFTGEEIGKMSLEEFQKNEDAIMYQYENLGVPYERQLKDNDDVVFVHEYKREDGTKVKSHYRSKPDGIESNNLYNFNNVTGGAAKINKNLDAIFMIQINKNELLINNTINHQHEDARNLANISLIHIDNIEKSTPEYQVLESGYAQYLNKLYKLNNNKIIPNNWKGIYFKEKSSLSKNISNSVELKEQLKNFYDINNKNFIKDKIDIKFSQNANLHRALGNATILQPYVDKNGYFHGILFDKYDFDLKTNDYKEHPGTTAANNYFMYLQKTGIADKYYIFAPVKFKW